MEKPNIEFVDECLKKLHHDRDLSSLLVGKLLRGVNKFIELYERTHMDETKSTAYIEPRKIKKTRQI